MLKNERLVHRLTLEQRISLLLSGTLERTSTVEGYEFPVFNLSNDPMKKAKIEKCTNYPSYKALSMTWNNEIIRRIAYLKGFENTLFTKDPLYVFDSKLDKNFISNDPLIMGNFLNEFNGGLNETMSIPVLNVNDESDSLLVEKEINHGVINPSLKNSSPKFVIVSTIGQMVEYKNEIGYKNEFLAHPKTKEEIVKFINNGVYQIFYEGDIEDATNYLVYAANNYSFVHGKYVNKVISSNEFEDYLVEGKALSLEKLEEACDNYVTFILRQEKNRKKARVEGELISSSNNLPYPYLKFDEEEAKAANESIVLLKNEGSVLPISPRKKVAIIGDAFKNIEYYNETFDHISSVFKTPFDLVKNYIELDYTGFAHGYLKGHESNEKLINSTIKLINTAQIAIVYLYADKKTRCIPEAQIEVINSIYKDRTIPIVAVLHSDFLVDITFLDKVSALLFVPNAGQNTPKAVLDILTGNVNPSGKLTTDYPLLNGDTIIQNNVPLYKAKDDSVLFPFGSGLSYSTFEYTKLEINTQGASFTVTNTSDRVGKTIAQLYIEKEGSSRMLGNRTLKGFKKLSLNCGETVRVTIPFDDSTFEYFNEEKRCYGIEGGKYKVYIATDIDTVRLEGTITLNKYLDKRFAYTESDELIPETFHEFENKEDQAKAVMFGKKLFISLALLLYVFALEAFIWYIWLFSKRDIYVYESYLAFSLMFVGIGLLATIIVIIYNVKNGKKKKKLLNEYMASDMTLTNLLENINDFDAKSKVVYEVKKEEEEEEIVEEPTAEEVFEEVEPVEETLEVIEEENKEVEEEEQFQEVELEVEPVEEVVEEIVDIENAVLSEEEIKAHELEEIKIMEEQNQDKEIADDFETYEDSTVFDNSTSLSQTVDRFIAYAENRGIIFELSSIRSLFSALASSKIIILSSKLKELLPLAVTILNDFLGNHSHIVDAGDLWTSSFYLSWRKDENGNYVKTDFVNDVYNACLLKNNINLVILNDVNMDNIDEYYKDFIDFANSPTRPHQLKLNTTQAIKIPENLISIIIPREDDYMDNLSKDLAKASCCVELIMRENKVEASDIEKPDSLSVSYLNDLVYESKKTWYLEEETWKKIDEFEAELNQIEPFNISNRLVLSIENYTSVFIDCGGDEADALDSVVSERLIPMVKTMRIYKEDGGIKRLSEIVEKCFGDENTEKIKRVLQSSLKNE